MLRFKRIVAFLIQAEWRLLRLWQLAVAFGGAVLS
jgi:hypothetical protein